ncbi:MAG TPA: alcohol dehydrogenase catalytic domain-containing protein, partial [Steroidobacteraceae bacterium]|nr:alcohol dehydrogenase catalytic domain-containing protein [Steroidobacteraceae bacterium]
PSQARWPEPAMTTMKAVRIRSFGGPEVLELADVEKPTPKDDEVLIRVRAASVNPVDYKIRSGGYPMVKQDQLPKVLGRDVAGEIERCGRAVRNFKEGDTVYAMLDSGPGGYAEYVSARAEIVAPKPAQLGYREAAAVPLAARAAPPPNGGFQPMAPEVQAIVPQGEKDDCAQELPRPLSTPIS